MKNNIKMTRVAGDDGFCKVTIGLRVNFGNEEAAKRFGRILHELIPEEDRAQFLADFEAAAQEFKECAAKPQSERDAFAAAVDWDLAQAPEDR